jgi:hypothetical protein
MTFPLQASIKKWARRSAGLLFALAVGLFVAFTVISSRERAAAIGFGEPYDSIGSPYAWFIPVAGVAFLASGVAIAVYFGMAFATRLNRPRQ